MPIYEVEKNGTIYEVDAPTPEAAAQALDAMQAAAPARPSREQLMRMKPSEWRALGLSARDLIDVVNRRETERTQGGLEFLTGMAKSALGVVEGGGKILRDTFPALNRGPEVTLPVSSEAQTPTEQMGKAVGNAAQFFVPGSALMKAKRAAATGSGLLDALFGAALEGASAATVEAAQRGSTEGIGEHAAFAGGVTLGMHGATGALKKSLGWLSERVEKALVKPTTADVQNGFQVANIFRYRLGGSLTQTFDKAEAQLQQLSSDLQAALRAPGPGGSSPQIDVLQALADAAQELQQQSARHFGQNNAIQRALAKLLDDPLMQQIQSGKADLVTANQIKQAVGDLGAWLHDPSGRVMADPDSRAMEVVANALYSKLRAAIEKTAVGDVARINRQISDIIPIRQAIIRRIPVDQRANVLNLGDLIGFGTGSLGLAVANRLVRSGQAANLAATGAEGLVPATAGGITGRGAASAASQTRQ